jgi:hypothetical protein
MSRLSALSNAAIPAAETFVEVQFAATACLTFVLSSNRVTVVWVQMPPFTRGSNAGSIVGVMPRLSPVGWKRGWSNHPRHSSIGTVPAVEIANNK